MSQPNTPRLIRIDTPERTEHKIPEGTTRIGRSRGLDLCLEDSAVSRFHCYLVREGDVVRVFEGESKNPALVDGEPVKGQRLKSGHTLRIGRCELVFEGPIPPTPATIRQPAAGATPGAEARPRPVRPRVASSAAARREAFPAGLAALVGVGVVVGTAVLVWLAVHSTGDHETRDSAESRTARQAESSQEELQRLMLELEKRLEHKQDTGRLATLIEEQKRRIAELKSELDQERKADREGGASPVPAKEGRGEAQVLYPELDSAPERSSDAGSESRAKSKTSVLTPPQGPLRRSKKDIAALVASLCAKIDDYATHTVFPKTIEPELRELRMTAGTDGAEGALVVYQHSRDLLRQCDASIESNDRKKEALLRKAAQSTPTGTAPGPSKPDGEPPSSKRGMYDPSPGVQLEANQRLLEAYSKAAEIHRRHRNHLVPLRDAVLSAISGLAGPEALGFLNSKLNEESDVDLCRAILPAFRTAGHRECVPVLITKLGVTRDAALRSELAATLGSITGADFGEKASAWAEWWSKSGK